MIISLADSCGLNQEVYGKETAKLRGKEIKAIIKNYPFADSTGKVIQQLHDTLTAVLIILISTSVTTVKTN